MDIMEDNARRMTSGPKSKGTNKVHFWIASEIMDHAVLSISLPHSYTLSSLAKFSTTFQQQNRDGDITLSWWLRSAEEHLKLQEDVANVLFSTFETLELSDTVAQLEHTKRHLRAILKKQSEEFALMRRVNFRRFLVFLFIQLYHRTSLRSPLQTTEIRSLLDTTSVNNSHLSPTRNLFLQSKVGEDADQLQFVKKHLYDLLLLLAGPEGRLTAHKFNAICIVLSGGFVTPSGVATQSHPGPVSSLLPFWTESEDALVDINDVANFLSQALFVNRELYPPTLLSAPTTSPKKHGFDSSVRPEIDNPSARTYVLSGIDKATVVKYPDDPSLRDYIKISCCNQSYIYILSRARFVSLFGCTNCTIVLGPVSKMITVEHCEHIRVISLSRALKVGNCTECIFNICVNTPPILLGNNHAIQLGPYNTHYPALEQHLQDAGVNPRLNFWDKPVLLPSPVEVPHPIIWTKMAPESFMPFLVPFAHVMQGKCKMNPCGLPQEYAAALEHKLTEASRLCEAVRAAARAKENPNELQNIIHAHFREWLVSSGNIRHVLDLLSLADTNGTN